MTTPKFALPQIALTDSMATVIPPAWNDTFTKLDAQVGFKTCTSSTRPGTPYSCQIIYETDTHLHRIWSVVDNAWKLITGTPLGIVSWSNAGASVTNTTIGTEVMASSLTFPSFYNHLYKFHVEGYLKNSTNSTNLKTTARMRWADGAGTVSIASTLSDSLFVDPLNLTASPTGIDVKENFVFESIQRSLSANANSTFGWSFINAGSIGSSGTVVGGTVTISVEDLGFGPGS